MRKVFNFSPGPAMVPEEVLRKAQDELLDWHGTGMSVAEIGHRTQYFAEIATKIEVDLRELLVIPDNYKIILLPGGASLQFSALPLNLLGNKKSADYVDTGVWSKKAITEGKKYGDMRVVAQMRQNDKVYKIPAIESWDINPDAAWLHYTANETIEGVEFYDVPEVGDVPLVSDMTSCLLSTELDVSKFGVIYAGAQKNLGIAGLAIVIVREDLLDRTSPMTPSILSYPVQVENNSMYNTPTTFAWYILGLVLQWIKDLGGLSELARINKIKSDRLYNFIDASSGFYFNKVHSSCRSRMNVPFNLHDESLTQLFLSQAQKAGLMNLKGHRLVGGVRASIYNAMPLAGIDGLIAFMYDFQQRFKG